ncbi:MAG TPA: DUF2752 domain-containing protein [Candidatus Saccharimonadales bacterium]|nr:DUF2752 domain-containing protein [Candidatus Saccharimonadales bacterium]
MNRLLAAPPWQVFLAMTALTVGALALVVLFLFDPSTAGFYPLCPFHAATGLWCPGCGSLRAAHQLTHGHLAEAWRLNPFFVTLSPVGLWLGAREAIRFTTGKTLPGLVTRPVYGWITVAGLVLFGIFRNVPLFH